MSGARPTLSVRTAWDLRPNRWTQRLEALTAAGAPLLDLTETNPTRCGLGWSPEALSAAFATVDLSLYRPHPLGLEAAREAVSRYYARRGQAVDAGALVLTASTSESYAFLFKLLCDPGQGVVCLVPGYPLLDSLAALEGVALRPLPMPWAGEWVLPREALAQQLEAADPPVRALVLVNPGNPTGQFLRRAEVEWLMGLCARHQVAVICDEVFADYGLGADPDRVTSLAGGDWPVLTFCLSGLSKVAALPQLKLGWLWAGGPPDRSQEALRRLEVIADTYLSVPGPTQQLAPALLEKVEAVQWRLRQRLAENRATLRAAQGPGSPWSLLPTEGGWAAVLKVPRSLDDEQLALSLLEAGVVVQPGHFFELPPSHLVLSLLPPPEVFAPGVERLARWLEPG